MSTSVVDIDVIEPRFMEDEPSSKLGLLRLIGASLSSSELERGVLDDDELVCADRLPDADFHDLRIDLRTLPFRSATAADGICGEADGDGVAGGKGGSAGDGCRDPSKGGVRMGTMEFRESCMNCMLGIEPFLRGLSGPGAASVGVNSEGCGDFEIDLDPRRLASCSLG